MKQSYMRVAALIPALAAGLALAQAVRFDYQVRGDFFAGLAGDTAALDRAMEMCEKILAGEPDHAEALVWHGAGLVYRSRAAFRANESAKGRELFERGIAETGKAVQLAPDNVGVRVPRGALLLTVSRFTPNPDTARSLLREGLSDYEHVLELQKAVLSGLGTHPRGELLFGLAEGYSRTGDQEKARAYFDRILRDLPDTAYAKRAVLYKEQGTLPPGQTGCVGCHIK